VTWQLLGRPDPVLLVEAGPGRGTLMADALRAVGAAAPDFARALRVHLIETSGRLRAAQALRVPAAVWHDDLATVPALPLILVANEFLDALPIRQFVRRGAGWTERFVGAGRSVGAERLVPAGGTVGHWIERPADASEAPCGRAVAEGDVVEVNQPARAFVAAIGDRLVRQPGAALLVDYGGEPSAAGDSLQALAQKRPVDPLGPAGSADLTAHVDFADISAVARAVGAGVQGPVTQGAFLTALGLFERSGRLASKRTPAEGSALIGAARRLADPKAMGELFKVVAMCSPGCPVLPGFTPA
jgi:NADH dehydrogenase [ubiquinone] 1 alpha subcomplex assembly factor 7